MKITGLLWTWILLIHVTHQLKWWLESLTVKHIWTERSICVQIFTPSSVKGSVKGSIYQTSVSWRSFSPVDVLHKWKCFNCLHNYKLGTIMANWWCRCQSWCGIVAIQQPKTDNIKTRVKISAFIVIKKHCKCVRAIACSLHLCELDLSAGGYSLNLTYSSSGRSFFSNWEVWPKEFNHESLLEQASLSPPVFYTLPTPDPSLPHCILPES